MAKTTSEAMTRRNVLLKALELDYRGRLGALALELQPRIESGELAPWPPDDPRWSDTEVWSGRKTPPGDVLEELCGKAIAPTREAAHLVLAVSPSGAAVDAEERGGTVDPRVLAGVAVAADLLELGRIRGWYTLAPEPRRRRKAS